MPAKTRDQWQFGDFQTPYELSRKIVNILKSSYQVSPELVIEPSCGKGSFILASAETFEDSRIIGRDVNPAYIESCRELVGKLANTRISIDFGNFFTTDWDSLLATSDSNILIIGNPPWVTSSELGLLNSTNVPTKTNSEYRRGIDAITGYSNFDISEWMILRYLDWLRNREGAIAVLCKSSVARKIVRSLHKNKVIRAKAYIHKIDAQKYFSAAVDACLLVIVKDSSPTKCFVFQSLDSKQCQYVIAEHDGILVRDLDSYAKVKHLNASKVELPWRSGIKHDCAKVMELTNFDGEYLNGNQERVEIETTHLYPLLKSSDIGNGRVTSCRKYLIVTQRYVGQETLHISRSSPLTWAYLESYSDQLAKRKSSIYKGKPLYSIFGVGEYTFGEWKVAISGLYKHLFFQVVGPIDGKPVVFDDTISFLSFDTRDEAIFVQELLMSEEAQLFYESLIFWDEKRPVTADILKRLSLSTLSIHLGKKDEYDRLLQRDCDSQPMQLGLSV